MRMRLFGPRECQMERGGYDFTRRSLGDPVRMMALVEASRRLQGQVGVPC